MVLARFAAFYLTRFATLYPREVSVSEDLRRAVTFLGWSIDPATVVRAGYGLGVVSGMVGAVVVGLSPVALRLPIGLVVVVAVLGAVHAVHVGPRVFATARRTSALGTAPELLVLAVLRMRLSPAPERAATFAAETGSGRLADSLTAHVQRSRGTDRSGLAAFGDEWDQRFPSLGRAVGLVAAAGSLPTEDRRRALDQAMDVALDGTRRQMQEFAGSVRGPATAVYAFGVLLPTALVALLPAARATGLPVTTAVVAVVYDVALPLVLLWATVWLLARRPVAFPPPSVGHDHPAVPNRPWVPVVAGGAVAAVCGFLAAALLPEWGPAFVALGVGLGTGLTIHNRPYVGVYDDVRTVERGLTDALSLIGRRVANGRSVERSIETTAGEITGAMGDVLAAGTRTQRRLDVGVEAAFLGEYGVLRDVPSPRVRGSVALLAIAGREGEPAGSAVLSVASHLEDLREVERDARESIRTVVETLRSTGALFGPLVGGATVAMADHLGGVAFGDVTGSIEWLGFAVGWYVLVLAALLTVLGTGLERGLDRHLLGYRVGVALLVATGAYVGGYLATAAIA